MEGWAACVQMEKRLLSSGHTDCHNCLIKMSWKQQKMQTTACICDEWADQVQFQIGRRVSVALKTIKWEVPVVMSITVSWISWKKRWGTNWTGPQYLRGMTKRNQILTFELWQEAGVPGENQYRQRETMQPPHKRPPMTRRFELMTFCSVSC